MHAFRCFDKSRGTDGASRRLGTEEESKPEQVPAADRVAMPAVAWPEGPMENQSRRRGLTPTLRPVPITVMR